MNAVSVAMYSKLTAANLQSGGTVPVFEWLAPENQDPPYVVFHKQANTPRYTMGSASSGGTAFENALYMVRAVTVGPSMAQAGTIANLCDAALNLAALSISGYTHLLCRRESDVQYVETRDGQRWNHAGALYRIVADPS